MVVGTIHLLKGRKKNVSLCGLVNDKAAFTKDPKKATCPQCLRVRLNHRAAINTAYKAKKRGEDL